MSMFRIIISIIFIIHFNVRYIKFVFFLNFFVFYLTILSDKEMRESKINQIALSPYKHKNIHMYILSSEVIRIGLD